jgi:predicted HicB family RNase H-like nuclease
VGRRAESGEPTTIGKAIAVRVGPILHKDLNAAAAREGRTVGIIIRRVMTAWLASGKPSPDPTNIVR